MILIERFRLGGLSPTLADPRVRGDILWNATLPAAAAVPMQVRGLSPATPLVKPGDRVREGMLIGASSGDGIPVHAPVPGVVREIRTLRQPRIGEYQAVVIDLEGEFDYLGRSAKLWNPGEAGDDEILELIQSMGVTEPSSRPAGLAGRIERVRAAASGKKHIIAILSDPEPLSFTEACTARFHPAQLVGGLELLSRLVPGVQIHVAYDRRSAAGARLSARQPAARRLRIRSHRIAARYPHADAPLIADAVLGIEYADEDRLERSGVLAVSASGLIALFDAVVLRKPMVERIVTVSGSAVAGPRILKARIGTSIAELFRECGGLAAVPEKVIIGSSMNGDSISDLETPIGKDTRMVLALGAHEINASDPGECIQCGECSRRCPVGLEPIRLHRMLERGYVKHAESEGLSSCIGCGICSSVCPSRLPLVQSILGGKEHRT